MLNSLYKEIREVIKEIFEIERNDMERSPLAISFEALQKMEEKFQEIVEAFNKFVPSNDEEEELKKFVLTPLKVLEERCKRLGGSTTYTRAEFVRDLDQKIKTLLAKRRKDYQELVKEIQVLEMRLNDKKYRLTRILLNPLEE